METTGLDRKQLTNWFTNARKRIWKPNFGELPASRSAKQMPTIKAGNDFGNAFSTTKPTFSVPRIEPVMTSLERTLIDQATDSWEFELMNDPWLLESDNDKTRGREWCEMCIDGSQQDSFSNSAPANPKTDSLSNWLESSQPHQEMQILTGNQADL